MPVCDMLHITHGPGFSTFQPAMMVEEIDADFVEGSASTTGKWKPLLAHISLENLGTSDRSLTSCSI